MNDYAGTKHPIWANIVRKPIEYRMFNWSNEFIYLYMIKADSGSLILMLIYVESLWNFYIVHIVLNFYMFRLRLFTN